MYPRLEGVLRASHNKSEATGVVRWEPPPGLYDENGNRTAPWPTHDEMADAEQPEQPEPSAGGNPYRLPSGTQWVSASVAEGERAENERMRDESLIDSIPQMQQQIQALMRRVAELEMREDTLVMRLSESGALPGFRDLGA